MTDDAIMRFILLIEVHFPRPKFSGDERREALWVRSMREIMSDYDAETLATAAEHIVRTRDPKTDGTMFPKPSECISACNKIVARKKIAEAMREYEVGSEKLRKIPAVEQPQPVFVVRPGDLTWDEWMRHFRSIERFDLAGEAEAKMVIKVSKRWPSSDAVVFEPCPRSSGLLAQLESPKAMPN